jgi:hypothetical protein
MKKTRVSYISYFFIFGFNVSICFCYGIFIVFFGVYTMRSQWLMLTFMFMSNV